MKMDIKQIVDDTRPYVTPIEEHPPVMDFGKSHGAYMHDLSQNKDKIDFVASYAAVPVGYSHPKLRDPEFEKDLIEVSRVKIANLDILTHHYTEFLNTFRRVVGSEGFDHFFFIDGGGLAVENAMKAAFDWKVRQNMRKGKGDRGYEILHFQDAFHGRTGYTLSVTNTQDPNKTKYFPKFNWPRVSNPMCSFPLEGENLEATIAREEKSKAEIRKVLEEKADDIAAILIETIQGEGGDHHFRKEFLQFLRDVCDEFNCLLIFDEVQCGMCVSGDSWTFESIGVKPDLVSFAKKAQVGGFFAGPKLMEEPDNVFVVPSRISSTWGSSLTDMVRCRRVLEIIEEENLKQNAADRGKEILEGLEKVMQDGAPISNIRGRGLFVAFDLDHPETRGKMMSDLADNGLLILPSGANTLRFRPHLNVTSEIVQEALDILAKTFHQSAVPA